MKKILLYIILFYTLISSAEAVQDSIRIDTLREEIPQLLPIEVLRNDIDNLLDNQELFNATIGISIVSLRSGEYVYKLNESKNFIPASTNKIITCAAALKLLGKDYRYKTSIYADGSINNNGEFIGDLIVKAGGDPTFSEEFYEYPDAICDLISEKLDSLGIVSIRGNIIVDDSFFDSEFYAPGWAWDDMIYSYSPKINPISINENSVDIYIKSGDTIDDFARHWIEPQSDNVQLFNNVLTSLASDEKDIVIERELNSNLFTAYGNIPYDSTHIKEPEKYSLSVDNPTNYFLSLVKESFVRNNIKFKGNLIDIDQWNLKLDYNKYKELFSFKSPQLNKIVEYTNKTSNNFSAEVLLKTIGKEKSNFGSFEKGIDNIELYLEKMGVNPNNMVLVDGSGLSRYNLISPATQTTILSKLYRSDFSEIFLNSLAKPGEKGTLKRRMTKSLAEKNVWAKSGSMNGISCLTGYVLTKDKEMLAFSIMINNFTSPISVANNLQDLLCMRLASFSRKN